MADHKMGSRRMSWRVEAMEPIQQAMPVLQAQPGHDEDIEKV
jgi:hypothetical protein